MDAYKIAVIGSGPGGLSAAAHAAELGISHVLLEGTALHANTIQRYQKGKPVMDEPGILPLRCPLSFTAGLREEVLGAWEQGLAEHQVNVKYNAEVISIEGQQGDFTIGVKGQDALKAEYLVLAIGVQGNPRRLNVAGEAPATQYQLDDPDEYLDETIIVIGAGDAAIENAIALAKQNTVCIVNRRGEFARAKQGNLENITRHIEDGIIECFYNSTTNRIDEGSDGKPHTIVLDTENGEAAVPCNRIIARLGADPPRRFVEGCGIKFPNDAPTALPELSAVYESSVPGLYVIGALGGYPLIKQAMNQGYEVVETILGNKVEPADHPILAERLSPLPFGLEVEETLALMRERILIFSEINPLQFREVMLESTIHTPEPGDVLYREGEFSNSFYTVLNGEVELRLSGSAKSAADPDDPDVRAAANGHRVGRGEVFGEQSLISGRPRSETAVAVEQCALVETPRRTMLKLINSNDQINLWIDQVFIARAIQNSFSPNTSLAELRDTIVSAKLCRFKPGEQIYAEGDDGDTLHLVRVGSLTVSRNISGREVTLAHVPARGYVGELSLMGNHTRLDTVRATVLTETISIGRDAFLSMMNKDPQLKAYIQQQLQRRLDDETRIAAQPDGGELLSFFMREGLGEATDVLLIDEALCVGCDNCEKACAATHNGVSRLNRAAGPSFASLHIPLACRHCEHPHCMKDCPPNALQRSADGAVYINDTCIGCGNCEQNCPYDAIHMSYQLPYKPKLWSWLLTGFGAAPGSEASSSAQPAKSDKKVAVKCDLCESATDIPGPACVSACPTGAALRVTPRQYVDIVTARN